MNVHVQFFSRLRDLAGVSEMELEVPEATKVAELLEILYSRTRRRCAIGTRAFSSPPESSSSAGITSCSQTIRFRSCRRSKADEWGRRYALSSRAASDGEGPRKRSLASALHHAFTLSCARFVLCDRNLQV